jgi:hypothetical protein
MRRVSKDRLYDGHPLGVRQCYHCNMPGLHRMVDGFKVCEHCRQCDEDDRLSPKFVQRVLVEAARLGR